MLHDYWMYRPDGEFVKEKVPTVAKEIYAGKRISDAVTERVGFRTIAVKQNRFYLNGREVQFHGVRCRKCIFAGGTTFCVHSIRIMVLNPIPTLTSFS